MSITITKVTAEELLLMPHDGFRHELVKGELRKMSPTGGLHGIIVARLTVVLGQHVEAHDLGLVFGAETGFKLFSDPDTVRAPDVSFLSKERIPPGDFSEKFWSLAPDLAVEVISPSETFNEVEEKVADYFSAGVRVVWLVNPKRRTVTCHRTQTATYTLADNDTLDGQDVVPGFQYELARLFAGQRR